MLQPTRLSPDGPDFSRIVVGVMNWGVWGHRLRPHQMLRLMEESVNNGVTTFDHADIYGGYTTEAEFGAALRLNPGLRLKMQLITKCGIKMPSPSRPAYQIKSYDTSAAHIRSSVGQSLKNLHTDYLDLLLLHRPSPLMNPEEVATIFDELRQEGKVRYFGVSNFKPSQFALLNNAFPLVTNQVEASLQHLAPFLDGTFDQCIIKGVRPMAWSPLGGGSVFTDKGNPQVQRIRAAAGRIMRRRSEAIGLDRLLLAWLMQHPAGILPVVGTARIERLRAAAEATKVQLTREEWYELWQASTGREVP
ncbi:MAG: aldo/keto reductase [Phaeodactylibacter sp.]|nr:aldo/keto reductase [Phaeodactylibacter sp.]MCB9275428.1 aldo/keto reductase [Lewinellaceae bacterium]